MIKLTTIVSHTNNVQPTAEIYLPFELRQKSRLLTKLETGEEVGLFLPRGTILRNGDLLQAEDGTIVRIKAAKETVSIATTNEPLLWAKACYHLGNRHVYLQISYLKIVYLHDHVLDQMVTNLGLNVQVGQEIFEPERGAYLSHGHHH